MVWNPESNTKILTKTHHPVVLDGHSLVTYISTTLWPLWADASCMCLSPDRTANAGRTWTPCSPALEVSRAVHTLTQHGHRNWTGLSICLRGRVSEGQTRGLPLCYRACANIRGQSARVSSLFTLCEPRDQTEVPFVASAFAGLCASAPQMEGSDSGILFPAPSTHCCYL